MTAARLAGALALVASSCTPSTDVPTTAAAGEIPRAVPTPGRRGPRAAASRSRRPEAPAAGAVASTTTTWPPTIPPATATSPPGAEPSGRPVAPSPPPGTAAPAEAGAATNVAVLACLRRWESGGNYGAVSSSGAHRGAYQFARSTWDGVARRHRPELVGVDPAAAAAGDQDEMAGWLLAEQGLTPWSVGRRCA